MSKKPRKAKAKSPKKSAPKKAPSKGGLDQEARAQLIANLEAPGHAPGARITVQGHVAIYDAEVGLSPVAVDKQGRLWRLERQDDRAIDIVMVGRVVS
jgi:hypothetical protein